VTMAKQSTNDGAAFHTAPTLPKIAKAEWANRAKTTATLTRGDLGYMAQAIAARRVIFHDNRVVPTQLKTGMTHFGVSTEGL